MKAFQASRINHWCGRRFEEDGKRVLKVWGRGLSAERERSKGRKQLIAKERRGIKELEVFLRLEGNMSKRHPFIECILLPNTAHI